MCVYDLIGMIKYSDVSYLHMKTNYNFCTFRYYGWINYWLLCTILVTALFFTIVCKFTNVHMLQALEDKDTPILQCHGDCDPIVPYKWGQQTASILKLIVKNTEFKTYRGLMHSSSEEVYNIMFGNILKC